MYVCVCARYATACVLVCVFALRLLRVCFSTFCAWSEELLFGGFPDHLKPPAMCSELKAYKVKVIGTLVKACLCAKTDAASEWASILPSEGLEPTLTSVCMSLRPSPCKEAKEHLAKS